MYIFLTKDCTIHVHSSCIQLQLPYGTKIQEVVQRTDYKKMLMTPLRPAGNGLTPLPTSGLIPRGFVAVIMINHRKVISYKMKLQYIVNIIIYDCLLLSQS